MQIVNFRIQSAHTINKITFNPGPPEMIEEQIKQAEEMKAKGND